MIPVFADTYYFLALRNPKDEGHARAVETTGRLAGRRVMTTAWVLTEMADALAKPANRAGFVELMAILADDPDVEVVPPSPDLFERGVALYAGRPDKAWSLTDCISFAVMADLGLDEALTGDHHFEQAGFRALLA